MAQRRRRQQVSHDHVSHAAYQRRQPRAWPWTLLLIAVAAATYWNAFSIPFLLDDDISVVRNQQIRDLSDWSRVLAPRPSTPVAGRPLVNLTFALNYAWGQLDVRGYHATNLALHVMAALALFGITRRTLALPALRADFGDSAPTLAGASALIWLVHPLQSETVDYVTQRTESMMGLFYLATLYCSIRAGDAHHTARWKAAAVAACALGMACKESMVTAPLMVVLYDRIFRFGSWRQALATRGWFYVALAATWIVLGALMWQAPRADTVGFGIGTSWWTYFLNQLEMIVRYIRLAIWPTDLVIDYGLPRPLVLADVLVPLVIVACLAVATVAALVWRPHVGFLGAWFFVTLAPTTSIVPIVTEVGAERRVYLPMAGIVVLVVMLVTMAARRASQAPSCITPSILRVAGISGLAVVALLLALGTVARAREYASTLSISQTAVDRWPNGRARFTLGTSLIETGKHAEGMAELRESARDYPGALYALGTELVLAGQTQDGLAYLQQFVERLPSHANVIRARELMGLTLVDGNRLDEAAQQFTLLLQTTPWYVDAHAHLGDVLIAQRRYGDAVTHYTEYLKARPNAARALKHMGLALTATNRLGEAIPYLQRAAAADPTDVGTQRELVNSLLGMNQLEQAAAHADQALRLAPDDPVLHDLFGLALARSGKLEQATVHFRRAAELDPTNANARANLTRALRLQKG